MKNTFLTLLQVKPILSLRNVLTLKRRLVLNSKSSFNGFLISKRGQALIEFSILSLAFVTVIQLLFVMAWIFINLLWIEHHLYQAILCVAQERSQPFCKGQLLREIRTLNPSADISSLNFNSSKGELKWRFYKKDFVIRQNFKLTH